jgi:hypothetical protein
VFASTTANPQCKLSAPRPVNPGGIKEATDNPEAFFRRAARKLDVRQVERLVIVEPDIGIGFGPGIARDLMVGQLQRQLMTAIKSAFEDQRRARLSEEAIPPVGVWGDGTPVDGAWKAQLRLNRSVTRGIDVHVVFRSPGNPPRVIEIPGHFVAALLPENYEQVLLMKSAKPIFKVREDLLDIEIEIKRPSSRLFCFFLEASGEATLLFPTLTTNNRNMFGPPRDGQKHFPRDFLPGTWRMKTPQDLFFHCITAKWVAGAIETQWLNNTIESRTQRQLNPAIDADMTRQLLLEIRRSEGYAEAVTEIVSR